MTWKVPQFVPFMDEREAEAAAAVVRSGWITEGAFCEQFLHSIKAIARVEHGVLAPNGTLALYLALKACGIDNDCDVIVPDLTFVASATSVIMARARPVFADVGEDGQLDWDAARCLLAGANRPTAIMPVHLYGAACQVPRDLPEGVLVIEDACQGLGVSFNGRPCGSMGLASAFSFFADKTITTGEGGFVGTNSATIYEKLRYLRNQGRLDRGSFIHPQIGQNFRMTDLQAAVGLAQLGKMGEIVSRKRAIFAGYKERLAGLEGVRLLEPPTGSTHIPFRTVAIFDAPAGAVAENLKSDGIEPRSAFYPLHRQPCFNSKVPRGPHPDDAKFPQAMHFWEHALCLPTFAGMTEEQLDLVCDSIRKAVES